MRADYAYMKRTFDWANREIFGGGLPEVELRLGSAGRVFGMFRHPRADAKGDFSRCSITLSTRFDVPEEEVTDTLIHEMIHLFIYAEGIADDGPHGRRFRHHMMKINREHGRHITVSGRCTDKMLESDSRRKHRFFCLSRHRNGNTYITVCAQSCIFKIHGLMSGWPVVEGFEWFVSTDPWFSRYPASRTPKLYRIAQEDMEKHVAAATKLVCDGKKIKVKK